MRTRRRTIRMERDGARRVVAVRTHAREQCAAVVHLPTCLRPRGEQRRVCTRERFTVRAVEMRDAHGEVVRIDMTDVVPVEIVESVLNVNSARV